MKKIKSVCALFLMLAACSHSKVVTHKASEHTTDVLPTTQVFFRFDSDKISPHFLGVLNDTATFLKNHPRRIALIEGYADNPGDDRYNLDLGDRRARVVKAHLVSQGVDVNQIVTVTFGENDGGESVSVKSQKRRVVLKDAGE